MTGAGPRRDFSEAFYPARLHLGEELSLSIQLDATLSSFSGRSCEGLGKQLNSTHHLPLEIDDAWFAIPGSPVFTTAIRGDRNSGCQNECTSSDVRRLWGIAADRWRRIRHASFPSVLGSSFNVVRVTV